MAELHVPDLPANVSREQVAQALAVLGIPVEATRSVEIGTRIVTVTQLVRTGGTIREVKTIVPIQLPEPTDPEAG